ncbi:MKI67 FHA domain-interacting nucleolar phosphoprotein [Cocos nucifera]|uniref:MKI67 FHA domain-interacting nucleolar phosphoprotein n=1 Tax=Cocos nucifera TaxID=13894 RepID=A0A8K0IYG2_COCNU|nr:MKI67 FHA domain-interacting nucleolar phosphoprotein [Cocos nucifera]
MGAKAKKALKKKLKKNSSQLSISRRTNGTFDFLPLEGGPGRRISEPEEPVNETATVLYIGHIPHGFYEEQMQGFFQQFGKIKRLRISRNRKTGKSKHYGFLEFENPEVAKVVADEMNNYLLFEHNLQLSLIPPERVHPKLWKGVNRRFKPVDWKAIARKRHNKERTVEEHQRMVKGILKRDEKRRKRIKAAGIDYECPDFVGDIQPAPKKIKFDEEED